MDQSNNINPHTGLPGNIRINSNADFFADDNSITINSITDDTIVFTTGDTITSSVYLSYALIDECSGSTTQVTISSWCQNTTPNFADKVLDLYTRTEYNINVIDATYTKNTTKGTVTFVGGTGDYDSDYTTDDGITLQGNVYIVPDSANIIAGDATITATTSSTITLQTNNTFTTDQIILEYSIQNECGIMATQAQAGTMKPFPPDTLIKDTLFHGEETKTLDMSVTVDSSYMNGRSFAIIGGGTLSNSCAAGGSTCTLQTTVDGGPSSTATSILYRCFLFVNNKLYYKSATNVEITNLLSPIANYDSVAEIGFLPVYTGIDAFWMDMLDITKGYTEVTSVNIVDQVVSVKTGPCFGGMSGFLAAVRYI